MVPSNIQGYNPICQNWLQLIWKHGVQYSDLNRIMEYNHSLGGFEKLEEREIAMGNTDIDIEKGWVGNFDTHSLGISPGSTDRGPFRSTQRRPGLG